MADRTKGSTVDGRLSPAEPWLLLQLADSAFPAGGFAHSGGLEASLALGVAGDIAAFVEQALWQAGCSALPLARAAHAAPDDLEALDALAEATLVSHVARRASRAQGRAFIAGCARAFPETAALEGRVRDGSLFGHLAPLQGAVCRTLGASLDDAAALVLHTTARGLLSAAVRLGALGPLEAQSIHRRLGASLEAVRAAPGVGLDDLAQTMPLADLAGALHDGLYSRLFQS